MGQMICFPGNDDTDEVGEEKIVGESGQTEPAKTTPQPTEKPKDTPKPDEPTEAGESKPSQPMSGGKHLTKLSRERVQKVWIECRGEDAQGVTDENVKKAIKDDDFDNSGVLEKSECRRLAESFMLRAKKANNGVKVFQDWEECFEFLDQDNSGSLEFEDIKYTMQAMWLLTKDKVNVKMFDTAYEEESAI